MRTVTHSKCQLFPSVPFGKEEKDTRRERRLNEADPEALVISSALRGRVNIRSVPTDHRARERVDNAFSTDP
jgi:hypothetical protein